MKESEAKNKICPFITDNQGLLEGYEAYCMTNKCIAWENTSTEFDNNHNDKSGYCKRLEK